MVFKDIPIQNAQRAIIYHPATTLSITPSLPNLACALFSWSASGGNCLGNHRHKHSETSKDWQKVSRVSGPQISEGKYEISEKSIEFRVFHMFHDMIAWFSSICNSRNFLPLASTPNHYGLEVSGQSLGEHASRVAVKGPGPTRLLRAHASVSNKMNFWK